MIDEHIILVEFGPIHLMQLVILTQACYSKGKIIMNLNVRVESYNGAKKKVSNKLNKHLLGIKKNIT
jgi:hypothetical protein